MYIVRLQSVCGIYFCNRGCRQDKKRMYFCLYDMKQQ